MLTLYIEMRDWDDSKLCEFFRSIRDYSELDRRWKSSKEQSTHKMPLHRMRIFDMEPICSFSPFILKNILFSHPFTNTFLTQQRRWQCLNWRWMLKQSGDDFQTYRIRICHCCCTLHCVYVCACVCESRCYKI